MTNPPTSHQQPLNWLTLPHQKRLEVLDDLSDADILKSYEYTEGNDEDFLLHLHRTRALFTPRNIEFVEIAGKAPGKDTLLGAYRDLERSEAILELIDNSIDAYFRRKARYPNACAQELLIFIGFDFKNGTMTYEDNAGGVQEDSLPNLVIPGFSDTDALSCTIGSYKTGGKKAIFKLANEARILTRYWNPVGTGEEAFVIHLDAQWIEDQDEYRFPVFKLKNKSEINSGQTIYTFRLKEQQPWTPDVLEHIKDEIQKTYTLLLVRNPNIKIHFMTREEHLSCLDEMYKFTGALEDQLDLRPRRVLFKATLPFDDIDHEITIEIVLGCRTTTATTRGPDNWGIDLYGNDRLFKAYDQDDIVTWYESITTGNARLYLRGIINIHGPNVFIPWDTHKRHLNTDREIVTLLRKDPAIREFFGEWAKAYNFVSRMKPISSRIGRPQEAFSTVKGKRDLHVAESKSVTIGKTRRKTQDFDLPKLKLPDTKRLASSDNVDLRMRVTKEEYRDLCARFGVGRAEENSTSYRQLADAIRSYALRKK